MASSSASAQHSVRTASNMRHSTLILSPWPSLVHACSILGPCCVACCAYMPICLYAYMIYVSVRYSSCGLTCCTPACFVWPNPGSPAPTLPAPPLPAPPLPARPMALHVPGLLSGASAFTISAPTQPNAPARARHWTRLHKGNEVQHSSDKSWPQGCLGESEMLKQADDGHAMMVANCNLQWPYRHQPPIPWAHSTMQPSPDGGHGAIL